THCHSGENCGVRTNPDIFPDVNGCRDIVAAPGRIFSMIDRCHHDKRADQRAVPDVDASLILKMTVAVDKNILAYIDVTPAFSVKWGKHPKTFIYRSSGETFHDLSDF